MPVTPGWGTKEDWKFQVSLSYIARPCLKNNKKSSRTTKNPHEQQKPGLGL
jgi:hypothetical protein